MTRACFHYVHIVHVCIVTLTFKGRGGSGGAMVLGKLLVLGRPTNLG